MRRYRFILGIAPVIAVGWVSVALAVRTDEARIKSAMKKMYQVQTACFACASSHDEKFPDGKSSNEAFRQLFIQDLLDDERLLSFSEKPGVPDLEISGKADGYAKALEPGECDLYFVRNIGRDDMTTPLIFAWVENAHQLVSVCADGGAKLMDRSDQQLGKDKAIERFLAKNNIDPKDVLAPEISHQQ